MTFIDQLYKYKMMELDELATYIPELPVAWTWIFLGIEAVAVLWCLLWCLSPLRGVRKIGRDYEPDDIYNEGADEYDGEREPVGTLRSPKVSVVVYSAVSEEVLSGYLEMLSGQEYPDYEVIVVCDATYETSVMLHEKYAAMYGNVYVTFIPPGSHNLSRKKLALTLGMKAASGDVVITTVANALIPGPGWISGMIRPFMEREEIQMVLGYSHPDYSEFHGMGRVWRRFATVIADSQWIGYSEAGHPYRGDGFNLAFRKEVFFSHKGYSKTMHLHPGDDDLFVSEIATGFNSCAVVTPPTVLTTEWGESARRVWSIRKEQYEFTSRWLRRGPFIRQGLCSTLQWVSLAAAALSVVTGFGELGALIAAPAVLLTFWLSETFIYKGAAAVLEGAGASWMVPLLWLAKPLMNAAFRLRHRKSRFKNFTWQRKNKHKKFKHTLK